MPYPLKCKQCNSLLGISEGYVETNIFCDEDCKNDFELEESRDILDYEYLKVCKYAFA